MRANLQNVGVRIACPRRYRTCHFLWFFVRPFMREDCHVPFLCSSQPLRQVVLAFRPRVSIGSHPESMGLALALNDCQHACGLSFPMLEKGSGRSVRPRERHGIPHASRAHSDEHRLSGLLSRCWMVIITLASTRPPNALPAAGVELHEVLAFHGRRAASEVRCHMHSFSETQPALKTTLYLQPTPPIH